VNRDRNRRDVSILYSLNAFVKMCKNKEERKCELQMEYTKVPILSYSAVCLSFVVDTLLTAKSAIRILTLYNDKTHNYS
jgi:hypothetical protein